MMSLSDWRIGVVDLTQDSDEDEGSLSFPAAPAPRLPTVPRPGLTKQSKPATPTRRPTHENVPLPGSSLRNFPTNAPRTNTKQTPSGITPPTSSSRQSSAASPASMGSNSAVRKNYVPVNTRGGTSDMADLDRAEKRRKLSALGGQTPRATAAVPAPPRQSANVAQAQPGPASSRLLNKSVQMNTGIANRPPSVHYMNAALKTNRATTALMEEVVASRPRPLQIGRMPQQDGSLALSSPSSTTPGESSTTSIDSKLSAPRHAESTAKLKATNAISSRRGPSAGTVTQPNSEERFPKQAGGSRFGSGSAWQTGHSYRSGPVAPTPADDGDNAMLDASLTGDQVGTLAPAMPVKQPTSFSTEGAKRNAPAQPAMQIACTPRASSAAYTTNTEPVKKGTQQPLFGPYSEDEEHLLIFLKEVKKMPWKTLTAEFNKDYPGRSYSNLQTRYSTKTNKRDRRLDPGVLKLPPRWTAEAVINWSSVHAENSGPRERTKLTNLHQRAPRAQKADNFAPRPFAIRQPSEPDYSSGQDSAPRRERVRRAPPVDYTWPRQRRRDGEDEAIEGEEEDMLAFKPLLDTDNLLRSETPDEQVQVPPAANVVDNEPMNIDFDSNDATLALIATSRSTTDEKLPYLTSAQRLALKVPQNEWEWDQISSRYYQGSVLHVDFSPCEMSAVEEAAASMMKSTGRSRHSTCRRHIRAVLRTLSEPKLLQLTHEIRHRLPSRDSRSVDAFLLDAKTGQLSDTPHVQRLAAAKTAEDSSSIRKESTSDMIHQRELGLQSRRGWNTASKPLTYQVRNKMIDTLGLSALWTGASSDIHTVAWSQDGEFFAAGAVAVTDPDSMQYNRPNNLLYGALPDKTIHELGEHSKTRQKTETGANSTHAMFVSQDSKLYTTVTSVAFSPSGKVMYSSGYDKSVCVWHLDAVASQPTLEAKLRHKAEVEMVVVNRNFDGVLATASKQSSGASVKLLTLDEDDPSQFQNYNFSSAKASSRSDLRILPQALQFEPRFGGLLLAGFGANGREDNCFDTTGDLCLWNIETQTQIPIHGSNRNVFDVSFNPGRRNMPLFAAGCVAGGNVNRGIRSVIRLYNDKGTDKYTCLFEIECRALDMNDVVWCPHDEHLIAAGCTDGCVYVWDIRWPDDPLRTLSHGRSLMPLQDGIPHERTDTGVRFLSWGDNATRLYSGSSDGMVKVWDVTRSREDTFIKDLIAVDSGIMAGAFSPDYSKLVLGEVNGSVNILDVGRDDCTVKDAERLTYVPYACDVHEEESITGHPFSDTAPKSGVAEGKHLLQTQQLQLAPMGNLPIRQVIQGPNYLGPIDQGVDAPFLREQALDFQLSMAVMSGPQCDIVACKDNFVTVTSEETGDSGRSADRIPDELRRQWKALDDKPHLIPGKSKCTHCGRPARPSAFDTTDAGVMVLCERCSFACFRCGAVSSIAAATTQFICDSCTGVWEIGALGYECAEQPALSGLQLDVPALRRFGRDMLEERTDDQTSTFGDEMNALTDYYFSLAIDRPESPPL